MNNVTMNPTHRPMSGHLAWVLLLAAALVAGCGQSGPKRYAVSGSVAFAGEPVAEGAIAFVPIDDTQGPRVGANIQQGEYKIDRAGGPMAGRYRVEVSAPRKTGRKYKAPQRFVNVQVKPENAMIDEIVDVIPPKYSGATSELVREVQDGGNNVFDFDLKAD